MIGIQKITTTHNKYADMTILGSDRTSCISAITVRVNHRNRNVKLQSCTINKGILCIIAISIL